MLNRYTQDTRTFYIADSPRGGGDNGDDPHDHDDYLAVLFKQAIGRAMSSSTPNQPRLIESVEGILERVEMAGKMLPLLSRDLQPIAQKILAIPGYSDKRNADILRNTFKNFDLHVEI